MTAQPRTVLLNSLGLLLMISLGLPLKIQLEVANNSAFLLPNDFTMPWPQVTASSFVTGGFCVLFCFQPSLLSILWFGD